MKQLFSWLFLVCLVLAESIHAQQLSGGSGGGQLTDAQLQTRNRLRQASLIVSELMKNPNAKTVILAGIYSGYNPDESINFEDLLNPTNSPAFRNNDRLGEVPATAFATAFRSALQTGQYLNSAEYAPGFDLESFLIQNNIQIYFPYSDMFSGSINPVVTFHPLDNEDTNSGFVLNSDGRTYSTVVVTDEVATSRPVFIVNFYEGGPRTGTSDSGNGGQTVTPRGAGSPDDCNIPPLRMSVQIKELRFMSQWDGLFAGGPEFVFVRGELAYNAAGTHVVTAAPQVRITMKRSWKGGWRGVNTVWDQRWEFQQSQFEELEQFFALYEDDPNTSTTFSLGGSVKAEIKIPKIGGVEQNVSANVSHTITSSDVVIYNQQLDRCYLINTNTTNLGLGLWQGLCVRGVGGADAVHWTLQLIPF